MCPGYRTSRDCGVEWMGNINLSDDPAIRSLAATSPELMPISSAVERAVIWICKEIVERQAWLMSPHEETYWYRDFAGPAQYPCLQDILSMMWNVLILGLNVKIVREKSKMVSLKDLLPFQFIFHRSHKSNETIIRTDKLKEGDCKVEPVWNWRKMRHVKYLVYNNEGNIKIYEIDWYPVFFFDSRDFLKY